MPHVEYRSTIDASAEDVFAWHARPGAFQRLTPPWLPVNLERFEGIRDGARAVIRLGYGPASIEWVAEHFDYVEGEQFCDRQLRGPFERWTHVHRMEPEGPEACTLIDAIDYELPLGGLGDVFGGGLARNELDRQFGYRHRITQQDLDLHQHYNPAGRSLTVAVSGTSGLIGSSLVAFLTSGGHTVKRLTRSRPVGDNGIYWNPREQAIEAEKLDGIDAVIHLAGENVFALRWTEAKKDSIMHSRRVGTRLIAEALAGLDDPPDVLLSASGISYYGDHGADVVTEETHPTPDAGFLSEVCRVWEQATQPASDAGIRTAQLRTGIVLTPAGGALQLMLPAFRLGLGGRIGAPDQYFPWIALDDVIGGYVHALWTDTVEGKVNLAAPEPVTMEAYAKTLAGVLNRPALLNVPGRAVRAVLGEVADAMLLQSIRARPRKLQDTGYAFRHPALGNALRHLLGKVR